MWLRSGGAAGERPAGIARRHVESDANRVGWGKRAGAEGGQHARIGVLRAHAGSLSVSSSGGCVEPGAPSPVEGVDRLAAALLQPLPAAALDRAQQAAGAVRSVGGAKLHLEHGLVQDRRGIRRRHAVAAEQGFQAWSELVQRRHEVETRSHRFPLYRRFRSIGTHGIAGFATDR